MAFVSELFCCIEVLSQDALSQAKRRADRRLAESDPGGKTLAYLLAAAARLDASEPHAVRALVLVPTRELGLQVRSALWCGASLFGGVLWPALQSLWNPDCVAPRAKKL